MRFTYRRLWLPLSAGVLLTVFFYLPAVLLSGGGHSLTAATIFFPYSVTLGQWLKDSPWGFVAAPFLLLQFPLYSLLLFRAEGKGKTILLVALLLAHSVGVVIGLRVERARKAERYHIGSVGIRRTQSIRVIRFWHRRDLTTACTRPRLSASLIR